MCPTYGLHIDQSRQESEKYKKGIISTLSNEIQQQVPQDRKSLGTRLNRQSPPTQRSITSLIRESAEATITATIILRIILFEHAFVFGAIYVFTIENNELFDVFECEFYMILKNFGDLFNDEALSSIPYPTSHTSPTDNPTPHPTHNSSNT